MNQLPTSAIFQPAGQQKGILDVHWQCSWKSQNSIPLFDQSVAKQVGLDLSNMLTPFSISLTITAMDSSKSWLSVSSQWNGVPGLSNWRNSSMRSVIVKAYDTWLMNSNQERMSVRLAGVGKLQMASRCFLHGCTLSG